MKKINSIVSKEAIMLHEELRDRLIYTISLLGDMTPASELVYKDFEEQPELRHWITAADKEKLEKISKIEVNPLCLTAILYIRNDNSGNYEPSVTKLYDLDYAACTLSVVELTVVLQAIENYFHKPV
jgi:hypothetical protein